LNNYSKDDITVFYEKCLKTDMRSTADFVTGVSLGIASSFGEGKKVNKIVEELRK